MDCYSYRKDKKKKHNLVYDHVIYYQLDTWGNLLKKLSTSYSLSVVSKIRQLGFLYVCGLHQMQNPQKIWEQPNDNK